MQTVRLACEGFNLFMEFDPSDELDCEIFMEAYLVLKRRQKHNAKVERQSPIDVPETGFGNMPIAQERNK